MTFHFFKLHFTLSSLHEGKDGAEARMRQDLPFVKVFLRIFALAVVTGRMGLKDKCMKLLRSTEELHI
jgi:hypothetical protein